MTKRYALGLLLELFRAARWYDHLMALKLTTIRDTVLIVGSLGLPLAIGLIIMSLSWSHEVVEEVGELKAGQQAIRGDILSARAEIAADNLAIKKQLDDLGPSWSCGVG
jgi:hypothetical protein